MADAVRWDTKAKELYVGEYVGQVYFFIRQREFKWDSQIYAVGSDNRHPFMHLPTIQTSFAFPKKMQRQQ